MKKRRASPFTEFKYFLSEGVLSVLTHGLMSFAAITVIAACLLITATFMLVSYNIDVQIGKLQNRDQIVVYIDEELSRDDGLALESKILAVDNVQSAEFVTKEEFFDAFVAQLGDDADVVESMRDDNPLRDSFRVYMKDIDKHAETLKALEAIDGIADSNSDVELSERLVQLRSVVRTVCYSLIILLGAVSLFIISNTVKLALFARREEIQIMKMVGATNAFIRAPFVVEGLILGVTASVFVFSAQWIIYNYVTKRIAAGSNVLETVPFEAFRYPLALWLLVAGVALGLLGSVFTIRRYMKV
ncbi:MAG: permease-like cell division protein FtsX [Clostridia bacterium]|nr:permease-like cell division protein FtsX [Clostridia bacterium]